MCACSSTRPCTSTHPTSKSITLSVDLRGKLSPGINQEQKQCKYVLVGVYTFPVTKAGKPLVDIDGVEPQDHPLPDLEAVLGEDGVIDGEEGDLMQDPLHEGQEEAECGEGEDSGHLESS